MFVQDARRIALDRAEVPFADRLVKAPRHEDLRPLAAGRRVGGRPEIVSGRIAQRRLFSHDAHARGQRLVAFQGFPEQRQRHEPPPGGFQYAKALAKPNVKEDVASISVSFQREPASAGSGVGLVAGRLSRGSASRKTLAPML